MPTKTILWGDGTTDTLTFTYTGGVGPGSASVSSSINKSKTDRTKTVKFKSAAGTCLATLSITQTGYSHDILVDGADTCVADGDNRTISSVI